MNRTSASGVPLGVHAEVSTIVGWEAPEPRQLANTDETELRHATPELAHRIERVQRELNRNLVWNHIELHPASQGSEHVVADEPRSRMLDRGIDDRLGHARIDRPACVPCERSVLQRSTAKKRAAGPRRPRLFSGAKLSPQEKRAQPEIRSAAAGRRVGRGDLSTILLFELQQLSEPVSNNSCGKVTHITTASAYCGSHLRT